MSTRSGAMPLPIATMPLQCSFDAAAGIGLPSAAADPLRISNAMSPASLGASERCNVTGATSWS